MTFAHLLNLVFLRFFNICLSSCKLL